MLLERKGHFLEVKASQSQDPPEVTTDSLCMSHAEKPQLCPSPALLHNAAEKSELSPETSVSLGALPTREGQDGSRVGGLGSAS